MDAAPRSLLVETFGPASAETKVARAPYRLAPLGAHTDHQLGLVLGVSLRPALRIAFRARDDRRVRAVSRDFQGVEEFVLGDEGAPRGTFGDYLRGVAKALGSEVPLARGMDAAITGDWPAGGVSSSAALAVAFHLALADVNGIVASKADVVRRVVAAERSYAGVSVGVLDPTIIVYGEEGRVVVLDCRENVPRLQRLARTLPPFRFLAVASGVPRDLRGGTYNVRVGECREAARRLGSTSDPPVLRDVALETLRRRRAELEPTLALRAEHVLTENKRVRDGLAALQQGDLRTFATLVDASAESMTRAFEAGVPETTLLADLLRRAPGVLAASYAGAGFGGGLFAVAAGDADPRAVEAAVRPAYAARFPQAAAGFSVKAADLGPGAGLEARP